MQYRDVHFHARLGRDQWLWTIVRKGTHSIANQFTGPRNEAMIPAGPRIDRWLTTKRTQNAKIRLTPGFGLRLLVALRLDGDMMKREKFAIATIYVPVKRRTTLKPAIVREIAQSMLEIGQTTPILVRRDGERFVLVHGLHRLEACKALGEETIIGYEVQAPKH